MSLEDHSLDTQSLFRIVGPELSESQIDAVFPEQFPERQDLVEFYLRHNGGGRTEQACLVSCGKPEHEVSRDDLEKITIEGFFSIGSNAEEKMIPFRPMLRSRAFSLRTFAAVPAMKAFLDEHMPIAFDHCGNDCWVDLQTGQIDYVMWDSWKEGPIKIAASFSDFVSNFWNTEKGRGLAWACALGGHESGIEEFERITGLKYGTSEALELCANKNRKS